MTSCLCLTLLCKLLLALVASVVVVPTYLDTKTVDKKWREQERERDRVYQGVRNNENLYLCFVNGAIPITFCLFSFFSQSNNKFRN